MSRIRRYPEQVERRLTLGCVVCDERTAQFFESGPRSCGCGAPGLTALLFNILAEVHDCGALLGDELLNGRAAGGAGQPRID